MKPVFHNQQLRSQYHDHSGLAHNITRKMGYTESLVNRKGYTESRGNTAPYSELLHTDCGKHKVGMKKWVA